MFQIKLQKLVEKSLKFLKFMLLKRLKLKNFCFFNEIK